MAGMTDADLLRENAKLRARVADLERALELQPIETAPTDGRPVLFFAPVGFSIGPAYPMVEPTRDERLAIYEATGEFPNVKYDPTHWFDLAHFKATREAKP